LSRFVLGASALLAMMLEEPGGNNVADVIHRSRDLSESVGDPLIRLLPSC
jgi:PIN domain nuclease of toxin-antitoxin system